MKRVLPLVELEWVDAQSAHHHSAWGGYEDFRDRDSAVSLSCHSVGYVIREDSDRIVIASHLALNKPDETPPVGEVSGTFVIPHCCILRRRDFK